nr:hypothetical protein [uncultured Desulfobulbus sp.]
MKAQERFNKILIAGVERIQDEVAALIGKPFKLGKPEIGSVDKETLFENLSGKQVLAHVRVEGDVQGKGCMIVGIKDAIFIGGNLIMLPDNELDAVVAEQEYSEELQDSYGEVANIICGALTVTFEEQYPKAVRLIRTEQDVFLPAKVDPESDEPIVNEPYYQFAVPMNMDGRDLGSLYLVLPAVPFGLAEAPSQETASSSEEKKEEQQGDAKETPENEEVGVLERPDSDVAAEEEVGELKRPESDSAQETEGKPKPKKRDVHKQKKLIDGLIKNSWEKMGDEATALLGGSLKITPLSNQALIKEDFLDQAGGKQIIARMDLRGGKEGEAFLFVELKSAVYLGGCLIMLPEAELEETVRDGEFGEDARDAYGEVTNIIAGVLTTVFEEQYRGKIGFVKTAIDPIVPSKIDSETDDVFINQGYYLALGEMKYNDRELGKIQFLVPINVFDLEELLEKNETEVDEAANAGKKKSTSSVEGSSGEPQRLQKDERPNVDMVIITDDDTEAGQVASLLEGKGYGVRVLHFKDPVNSVLSTQTQMVFLIMREVSEQGFGVAIKVSSSGISVPLVAAGPAWTRTAVLKAVKYGACDILITPSSSEDVEEKLVNNLVQKAA